MLRLNTISASVFVSNVLILLLRGLHRHAFLFSLLFLTSVIVHEIPSFEIYVLDQIAFHLVALNGAWLFYKRFRFSPAMIVALTTFLGTVYLYHYGKTYNVYCFDPECGLEWHSFMHVVFSLGHHAIAIL